MVEYIFKKDYMRDIPFKEWPTPKTGAPSLPVTSDWINGYDTPLATDGCQVEPDGICPHGHPSWLIRLGYV